MLYQKKTPNKLITVTKGHDLMHSAVTDKSSRPRPLSPNGGVFANALMLNSVLRYLKLPEERLPRASTQSQIKELMIIKVKVFKDLFFLGDKGKRVTSYIDY